MQVIKAQIDNIGDIIKIINEAKLFLKSSGIPQWQSGYPNEAVIRRDIENGIGYIIEEDRKIAGYFALSFSDEECYRQIFGGKWLNDSPFAAIHRVCFSREFRGKGFSEKIFEAASSIAKSRNVYNLKSDTHEKNIYMQKALLKAGFKLCGVIKLMEAYEYGSERVAFQKIL